MFYTLTNLRNRFFFYGGHGIHSPFAFRFTTHVLQDRKACYYSQETLQYQFRYGQKIYPKREQKILQLALRLHHYFVPRNVALLTDTAADWFDPLQPHIDSDQVDTSTDAAIQTLLQTGSVPQKSADIPFIFSHLVVLKMQNELAQWKQTALLNAPYTLLLITGTRRPAKALFERWRQQMPYGMGFRLAEGFLICLHPSLHKSTYTCWLA